MQLSTMRKMVVTTIALLLIYQVGTFISALFGVAWAGTSALVIAAVSYACARLARTGAGETAWFLVPTLLFTILPIIAKVWLFLTEEQMSLFDKVASIAPLLIGFVIPVLLLLLVYHELRKLTVTR